MPAAVATKGAYDLFHRGSVALARMEQNGIRIDTDHLELALTSTSAQIKELQARLRESKEWGIWRKAYGDRANVGSREQLGNVVFGKMKVPYRGEFTKTGRFKADEKALAQVGSPFVRDVLRLESLKKLRGTYLKGIKEETVDGYLHPFFNLTGGGGSSEGDEQGGARSYRGSSSAINFQNLPVRDPEHGKTVRDCFIPRKGRRLVENDFKALEFSIAACFWRDPAMIDYASDPLKDVHRDQAADIFKCDPKKVTKHWRYLAKNGFVFPTLYGSFYPHCARNIWGELDQAARDHLATQGVEQLGPCDPRQRPQPGTFEHHMKGVEDRFLRRFPTFARGKEEWFRKYQRRGWFRMMTGFVVQGLYSRNALMNYPIQGPAFHCLLWTVTRLQEKLDKREMEALLVGEIHDCSLGDVPDDEVQTYLRLIKRVVSVELPKAWPWVVVPLGIEAEVTPLGGSWHTKQPWIEKEGVWGLAA